MPTETKANDGSGGWPPGMEIATQTVGTPGSKPINAGSEFAAEFLRAVSRGIVIFNPQLIFQREALVTFTGLVAKAHLIKED